MIINKGYILNKDYSTLDVVLNTSGDELKQDNRQGKQ